MSSDKNSLLPKKLPNDNPTRPWCGLHSFFSAFVESYDHIIEHIPNGFDAPTNKNLIIKLQEAFSDFTPIFKNLEAANTPTLHLVILSYCKMISKIEKWPSRLDKFKNNIRKRNTI